MHDPPQDLAEGWHPDPSGGHQHRWWDGSSWTQFVADDGVARAEPPKPEARGAETPKSRRSWRRRRTQDEWIDLGWKTSGCGCSSIPVMFALTIAVALVLYPFHGDAEPGPLASAIYLVLEVLLGLSFAMGFIGAIVALITLVAGVDRRIQRRRRRDAASG